MIGGSSDRQVQYGSVRDAVSDSKVLLFVTIATLMRELH